MLPVATPPWMAVSHTRNRWTDIVATRRRISLRAQCRPGSIRLPMPKASDFEAGSHKRCTSDDCRCHYATTIDGNMSSVVMASTGMDSSDSKEVAQFEQYH